MFRDNLLSLKRIPVVVVAIGFLLSVSTANAGIITINATWLPVANNPVGNAANVTGEFSFDPSIFQYDNGSGGVHQWHFYNAAGQWSTTGVIVTGSTTLLANGTFGTFSFTDLVIYSTAADALLAISSPDLEISLQGAVGAPGSLPPNASGIPGRMQVGSGGGPGLEYVDFSSATLQSTASVPEPSSVVLMGLGVCGVVIRRWHRRKVAEPQIA